VLPKTDLEYFGDDGDRMHMMFNFQVNQHLFHALATADTRSLAKALVATRPRPASAQWGVFLRNHDELDLGRLSDADREKVFRAFAPEPDMQLYGRGIRRRLAPMLNGDRRRLELAYSLLFTLPGTPVLRYGDELGMGEDLRLPERNCARTPMQWSSLPQAGFSSARRTALPVISEGPFGYERVNVADQRRDRDSLLNWMARMVRIRKECPQIAWGDFTVVETQREVLAVRYDWQETGVLALHNLSEKPASVRLRSRDAGHDRLVSLLDDEHSTARRGWHDIELDGHAYRWFRVGGLDDILRRRGW
jgi:maltose alpha-D-glucosyltransferase/alpha-amylase